MKQVLVRMLGGPRDGDQMELDAAVLGRLNIYLSAPNAPGTYWRPAGLGPLVLEFLPAPGGHFTEPPVELKPFMRELALCQ